MLIKLLRARKLSDRTIGQLYIDDEFFCFTLEDTVREVPGKPVAGWKVFGETAIPSGKYKVTLEFSPKFGPDTLTVNDVPGFSGIRIHAGNSPTDTEGCIIVGYSLTIAPPFTIVPGTTRTCVLDLKVKVKDSLEEVWISIV